MLGSLLLASFLMEKGVRNRLQFRIPLISDNQGNIFAMLNQSTRKMPTAGILMQLVLSLHQQGCQLAPPSYMKWDLNTRADELIHPDPHGFNPAKRLRTTAPLKSYTLMNWVFHELYPTTPPS